MAQGCGTSRKVTCDDCFFRRNGLCALVVDEPCATFRPNPRRACARPAQLRFVFRTERRTRAAWAFPTPRSRPRYTP